MGWFADRTGTRGNKHNPAAPAAMMTAAGARINLQDRNIVNTIAATKMNWQHQAWNYRDLVGEMSSALRFRANAIAKCALIIGQVNDLEDTPIPVGAENFTLDPVVTDAAQDALARLPWRNGGAFGARIDTSFSVTGEAWLHGKTDPATGEERWTVRSTDEIMPVSGGSNLGIVEVPGRPAIPIDKETEALLRLWNPHPRFAMLADSPIRSMLDVCEDIVLIGREIRAASRSRIAANGLLLIPDSMSVARKSPGGDSADAEVEEFAAGLEAAMLAPIANEGDAGAVVPIVIRGDTDDIAAVKHIQMVRETSPILIEKLDNALKRMGETLDVPPTVVTGLQDTNHWNAYVISDETWNNHIEPGERLIVDSLTEGYLRPILQLPVTQGGYGLTRQQAQTVQVWYDASAVTKNPNRSADAQTAFGLGAIGYKALLRDMGFEESDAPSEQEAMRMLAFKQTPDPQTAAQLINLAFPGIHLVVPAPAGSPTEQQPAIGQPATVQPSGPRAIEQAQPPSTRLPAGQASVPAQTRTGQPAAPPVSVRGAADQQRVLDSVPPVKIVSGQSLVDLDRQLRARLLDAADQAITTAVEKAAKRIVSAAQHKVDASVLADHRGADLAAYLGPDGVAELGLTDDALLSAAFAYLYEKFMAWSLSTIADSIKLAVRVFGLELHAAASLRSKLAGRRQKSWARFEHSVKQRALAKLYGRGGVDETEGLGEKVDSIVMPGDVRTALAEIGGGHAEHGQSSQPLGGIATGPDMLSEIDRKMDRVGFIWEYGITDGRRHAHFIPHLDLDGQRFTGWDDAGLKPDAAFAWVGDHYKPGDHKGCMCDYVWAWALDEHSAELQRQLAEPESPSMAGDRLLADLDQAAGRTGTTAQRAVATRERVLEAQRRWLANTDKARSGS
jgi:hypothetical protein